MANEISTVQSLKAVDAWIDVINANINGGVRTAFKSSRLKFGGSNTNVSRTGNSTSLPLQFPEPGLATSNTVIDFSQGAITASTESSHLAIQGEGFFLLASPDLIDGTTGSATLGATVAAANGRFLVTRDGEFHADRNGLLRNAASYYLVTPNWTAAPGRDVIFYNLGAFSGTINGIRAVFDNAANATSSAPPRSILLSDFAAANSQAYIQNDAGGLLVDVPPLIDFMKGRQNLKYSSQGSTVFDFGFVPAATLVATQIDAALSIGSARGQALTKSLEASNASMTQSVPELSLAQKLFSALTKVLQISQTNTDAVLNLVR